MKRQNDKNINLKLSIVEYIKDNNKLPSWFSSKSKLDYYTRPLKVAKVIFKLGYGVWSINWDNWLIYYTEQVQKRRSKSDKQLQKNNKGTNQYVRGHGYQFYLQIPKRILWNHNTRKNFIIRTNLSNQKKEGGVYKIRVLGHKVWFCDGGIIIYFPEYMDFRGSTAKESKQLAVYEFERVVKRIERLISVDLSNKGKYMFSIDKAHYSDVNDELAKLYNDNNDKFKVVGADGKVWLLIDKSHNQHEKECTHAQESENDHDGFVAPFHNDMRNHYKKTGEPILLTNILTILNMVVEDRLFYAENMNSHVKAIQELGKGVNELRKEIKNFNK